tara:strand:+ start:4833 stop:5765 length:933 start_codon:yes stop_codon:yes gene_type:complete
VEQWMTENNREKEESAGQDLSAAEQIEPVTDTETVALGDRAGQRFPTQVRSALEYAAANKYAYGPRLRNAELTWNVVSAESMTDDIVRVRVEFAPASGFRGDSGIEYMDVDANGSILARRQIRIPKENTPVLLIGITGISIILAVIFISLMTWLKPEAGDPLYVAGRTLWIRAERPESREFITYTGLDSEGDFRTWVINPENESENDLVYVKVSLFNETSGSVNLVIDEKAAKLLDGDRTTYLPLNTIDRTLEAEAVGKVNSPEFMPMWGSLTLDEGEQVVGMLVFELPEGSSFTELRWAASDTAVIKYQ